MTQAEDWGPVDDRWPKLLEVLAHGIERRLARRDQAGKDAGLLPRPPLRTVRAGFPAYGSSTPRRHRLF
ncbi:MAG: hypothetical protein IJ092_14715, partial [Atopobiaceae bacterium]|nr:hypothetical protein [Atopobiaceae bacterium]